MEQRGAVFSHYRPDTTPQSRPNVASVTKSVVALLVGIAIGKGLIAGVEEPLSAFFPEHARGPQAATLSRVTLRHLLTMSSGFDRLGLDADSDYTDFAQRLYAPGQLQHALSRRLVEEPGKRFYYSNISSHLVALAVARRVKVPLTEFARDELFGPLGIPDFDWPGTADGTVDGASGLRLTAPEMLRIGRTMLAGGRWEARQVVPESFVQDATRPQVARESASGSPAGYGYLWWTAVTPGDGQPLYAAAGYGGQYIYVVPARDLVVVTLTESISREVGNRTLALIQAFALPAAAR